MGVYAYVYEPITFIRRKTMQFNTTTQLTTLSLGLVACLLSAQLATATPPTASIHSIPPPSGGKIGGGPFDNGGQYEGPGDTVPPCGDCAQTSTHCGGEVGYLCDAPVCNDLEWTPDVPGCKYPQFGYNGNRDWSQGYMLTIGDMVDAIQNGTDCFDDLGFITMRISSPFPVGEVHVFESGWINGFEYTPIDHAVNATVCFDGNPTVSDWAFDEVAYDYDCEYATVTVSFHVNCIHTALLLWYLSDTNMDNHQDDWLFYVDFVSCDPCD